MEHDDDAPRVLGARLREARDFLGLSQEEVARALGIPRTAMVAIEKGQRNVTGLELRRFARLYHRPVGWLLGEDTEPDAELLASVQRLGSHERSQILRFAEFLAGVGQPPAPRREHLT